MPRKISRPQMLAAIHTGYWPLYTSGYWTWFHELKDSETVPDSRCKLPQKLLNNLSCTNGEVMERTNVPENEMRYGVRYEKLEDALLDLYIATREDHA